MRDASCPNNSWIHFTCIFAMRTILMNEFDKIVARIIDLVSSESMVSINRLINGLILFWGDDVNASCGGFSKEKRSATHCVFLSRRVFVYGSLVSPTADAKKKRIDLIKILNNRKFGCMTIKTWFQFFMFYWMKNAIERRWKWNNVP